MLALNNTIRTIQNQLREFTVTAKLLIAALMVILIMSLILVSIYAGRSELVPLGLRTDLSPEARASAVAHLKGRGIAWEDRGDDLYVPPDQKYAVLADFTENKVISTEQIDFDSMLKDDSPFTDRHTKRARYLVAKMNKVAEMISEMSGVERASVVIDQPEGVGGIGVARIEPSATVTVLARGSQLSQVQADSIANIVAGAHAALKVEHVTVIDARTDRMLTARTDDDLSATKYLEVKQAAEKDVKNKLQELLSFIQGSIVAVNAQVDATELVQHSNDFQDPKIGVTEESSRERSTTSQSPSSEPGIRPNAGAQINAGGGRSTQMTETETNSRMNPAFGTQTSQIVDPKGYAVKINATVLVPRSYFILLYKSQADDESEPDQATLDALVPEETDRIKKMVEPLIDTSGVKNAVPGQVVVSMFADLAPVGIGTMGDGFGGASGGSVSGGLVSEGIIKSVGLGALALVSLLLMFMMVRKAGREEELPSAEELGGVPPALADSQSDLVGEAVESTPALEGMEIDEESMRHQQMLDQINDLATSTPDEAAGLLRKWIRTDE